MTPTSPVPPDVRLAGNEAQRALGLARSRALLEQHDAGATVAELAAEHGVTLASMRSKLTRARRRLGRPTPTRNPS